MTAFWLTAYVLVWPVIAALVMGVLCVAIVRDLLHARREGHEMV